MAYYYICLESGTNRLTWGEAQQKALLEARHSAGLTRAEMGEWAGCSGVLIQKLEMGYIKTIDSKVLLSLCSAMRASPGLFGYHIITCEENVFD